MCDQENGLSHHKASSSDDVTLADELLVSDDSEPEEEPSRVAFDPQLTDLHSLNDDDEDDDDDDEGEVQLGAADKSQSSFSLKGGSSGFSSRSLSIFGCLDSVARPASAAPSEDSAAGETFARPSRPPPRAVPDYLLHPERWTRYSLEDVAESSERENSEAARQFLSSLQQRKQQQQLDRPEQSSCSQHKVIFSRPSGRPGRERLAEELKAAGGREMSLSHLEEEEEEGGEGGSLSSRRTSEVKEKSREKVEERGDSVGHLDQEDEEKEEEKEEVKAAVKPPPQAEERKRKWKWEQQGGAAEEEEEEKQQVNPGFTSFRKSNRKNYRRSSEQDDS